MFLPALLFWFCKFKKHARSACAINVVHISEIVSQFDHEMISTVILLPSADSFKKDCCRLQA